MTALGENSRTAGLLGRHERAAAVLFAAGLAAIAIVLYAGGASPALRTSLAFASLAATCGWAIAAGIRARRQSARTTAEAERQTRRHGESMMLVLNDGGWLWETDKAGRMTQVSQGLAAGQGQPVSALLGQDFATLFGDGSGTGWDHLLLAMDARQAVERAVELPLHGCRTRWQITARPISGAGGSHQGYRGIARNITAERLASRKLADERDALMRDNAVKSRFLAAMADEFRTPLSIIVGYAELLLSPPPSLVRNGGQDEHLKTILDTGRQLQALAADILHVTRIEKGSLGLVEQEADAAEIAEVAVKMCRDAAAKAHVTIMASVIDGIELRCDVARIKQIVVNLVRHAVHLSQSGGTVYLDFETPADDGLVIAVHNAGAAIAPGDLARTFQPFAQGFGAFGLGLPIARQIALLHGGDVTIESAEGAGTTARLSLPALRVTGHPVMKSEADCAA